MIRSISGRILDIIMKIPKRHSIIEGSKKLRVELGKKIVSIKK